MQAKLLRFLQNGEVQRLGTSDLCRVDVRVLCATNASLPELVRLKRFREDLFYRLAVFPITVPPLRERLEDIAALAAFFLARLCTAVGVAEKHLSAAALEFLQHSRWAGNVRELQHLLERAFILSGNEPQICPESFRERNALTEFGEL
jgi:transcriptional regulator with GAF, ATPase, and Fis domain